MSEKVPKSKYIVEEEYEEEELGEVEGELDTLLEKVKEEEEFKALFLCPSCGAFLPSDKKICDNCGVNIDEYTK